MEAKRNIFEIGHGLQQALAYAEMLDAPFAISSNGDGFLVHDRTGITQPVSWEVALDHFPTYDELWAIYQQWKQLTKPEELKGEISSYQESVTGRNNGTSGATNRGDDQV